VIECRTLFASAGKFALEDISFTIPRGKWGIVLGPTGAGKTTLLETIAGVRRATRGDVFLRDVSMTTLPAELRRVGIVYQHGFLFPHLSVAENVGYGAGGTTADATYAREVGGRLGIETLWTRRVTALSGGERQVVALARALAPRPDVLLLDEPFTALDPRRRTLVRRELRAIVRERELTVLQVTHDFAEAGTVGDVALLMEGGRLVQSGSPEELFRRPASAAAAEFVGAENLWAGAVREVGRSGGGNAEPASSGLVSFRSAGGLELFAVGEVARGQCHAVVRGEDVILSRERPNVSSVRNVVEGRVVEVAREGALARVTVEVASELLVACVTTSAVEELALREGVSVFASVKATAVHLC
jgi:molybdopterin-binding protein